MRVEITNPNSTFLGKKGNLIALERRPNGNAKISIDGEGIITFNRAEFKEIVSDTIGHQPQFCANCRPKSNNTPDRRTSESGY